MVRKFGNLVRGPVLVVRRLLYWPLVRPRIWANWPRRDSRGWWNDTSRVVSVQCRRSATSVELLDGHIRLPAPIPFVPSPFTPEVLSWVSMQQISTTLPKHWTVYSQEKLQSWIECALPAHSTTRN